MAFWSWSRTPASNATADTSINYSEGQAPSSLNDSARAAMARLAEYRDDIAGAIVTGGTSTAYTVTSYQVFDTLAHMNGALIAFTPHVTNGAGPVTLATDAVGIKPLRPSTGVELQSNVLIAGTPYMATYNNSDAVWYLHSIGGNTYGIPLGAGMDFWLPTAPSSAFVFPIGQAISRTTYATLYAAMGTTHGAGDGSTTFNLPDKRERVSVMKTSAASRLTSTYFGGDSTALGATGGSESSTLITGNLPAYTPSGTFSASLSSGVATGTGQIQAGVGTAANAIAALTKSGGGTVDGWQLSVTGSVSGSITGTAQGGSSTPVRTVQPTIVCNYILRVI